MGVKTTLFLLIAALVVGLVVFNVPTRDLSRIIQTVIDFRNGDLAARVQLKPVSDLAPWPTPSIP